MNLKTTKRYADRITKELVEPGTILKEVPEARARELAEILEKEKETQDPIKQTSLKYVQQYLDRERQKCLLESIHDIQTLLTCTGMDELMKHRFTGNRVFQVTGGKVSKESW